MRTLIVSLALLLAAPAQAEGASPGAIPPPPPGKGQVVFFRQGSKVMVTSCAVSIGEQRLSSLKPSTYFIHVTEPRTITYTVKAEKRDDLTLEIEPDRTHFVRCTIGMGFFSGRPNLAPSSEDFFNSVRDGLEPLPTVGSGL